MWCAEYMLTKSDWKNIYDNICMQLTGISRQYATFERPNEVVPLAVTRPRRCPVVASPPPRHVRPAHPPRDGEDACSNLTSDTRLFSYEVRLDIVDESAPSAAAARGLYKDRHKPMTAESRLPSMHTQWTAGQTGRGRPLSTS